MYQQMINRKNSKKGFTLVEVIVVLVILAILAAIMIPAMTGWIDKANEKSVIVEARAALLAAQTLASESYGVTGTPAADEDEVISLAGVKGTASDITFESGGTLVTGIKYSNSTYTATYASGKWTVDKD